MSCVAFELGDRSPQGLELRDAGGLALAKRLQLGLALGEPLGQGHNVRACPRRHILGCRPPALLLGQLPLEIALLRIVVAEFDERSDAVFPAGFPAQPGDADVVHQFRNGSGGEPPAKSSSPSTMRRTRPSSAAARRGCLRRA